MTMQDPIADLLTRIRNAQLAGHESVVIPHSKLKGEVIRVLKEEGYIEAYQVSDDAKPLIEVTLKYSKGVYHHLSPSFQILNYSILLDPILGKGQKDRL